MLGTLLMRCKKCGHESITHKNGKILKGDFIRVAHENIFKRKILCPICNHDRHEMDHDKETCPCIYCIEDRMKG